MKRTITACSICLCTLMACEQRKDDLATTRNEALAVEPDNAKRNERDRDDNAKTPLDQGNNERDLEITAEIRRQVLAQPNFSTNAQNVKIISENGTLTLRGPVDSTEEKATIERLARAQAGVTKFVSEIEVRTEDKNVKE
jgi:hyperosmotically inducible periplasmic protein